MGIYWWVKVPNKSFHFLKVLVAVQHHRGLMPIRLAGRYFEDQGIAPLITRNTRIQIRKIKKMIIELAFTSTVRTVKLGADVNHISSRFLKSCSRNMLK